VLCLDRIEEPEGEVRSGVCLRDPAGEPNASGHVIDSSNVVSEKLQSRRERPGCSGEISEIELRTTHQNQCLGALPWVSGVSR
jgi:hypothetical protein